MNLEHAAAKWGKTSETVLRWARGGRIPGAFKTDKGWWCIPDNAVCPPPMPRGRPPASETALRKKRKSHRMDREEAVAFIRENCAALTYSELERVTGFGRSEIRRIYEHLHDAYGV